MFCKYIKNVYAMELCFVDLSLFDPASAISPRNYGGYSTIRDKINEGRKTPRYIDINEIARKYGWF